MIPNIFPIEEIDDRQSSSGFGEKIQILGQKIKNGEIAVIPTDTIYGIVGSALNQKTVERIYKLRRRNSLKPMIILIESKKQILDLGVNLSDAQFNMLFSLWPNPLSIVVEVKSKDLSYLHRGMNSLAFRMPDNQFLLKLLKITGPIVAPSANFEGEPPALSVEDAVKYFQDKVSFYIDGGELKSKPSTVAKLDGGKLKVLRDGAAKIPKQFLK